MPTMANLKGVFLKLNIIYEDKYIIVCHKPAGIASQNDRSFNADMCSMIKNHFAQELRKCNKPIVEPYVGVVHRLDKPVEGIIVYGKTKQASALLSKQVSESSGGKLMTKKYIATVDGELPLHTTYSLENYLYHDKRGNVSSVVDKSYPNSKLAKLNYTCIEHIDTPNGIVSKVDITLLTGRHHQIRVQFSNLGHPIIGDNKYNNSNSRKLELCAYSLTFVHPNGNEMTFSLDMNT